MFLGLKNEKRRETMETEKVATAIEVKNFFEIPTALEFKEEWNKLNETDKAELKALVGKTMN